MTAMDNATRNAEQHDRSTPCCATARARRRSPTELIEIISGAEAL
jgi:F0F1-type ATP synthase gamma subunit